MNQKLMVVLSTLSVLTACGGGSNQNSPFDVVLDDVTQEPVEPPVTETEDGSSVVAGTCIDTGTINDGWGWNGVTGCQLPIAQPEPEPEPQPVAAYLIQSVNYYCSTDDSGSGWIWNFSSDNQLRDSENLVVGNWSWATNNSLTLSPIGNTSVSVVDQTNRLGLFNVNDNQQWGSCTIATTEQLRVANLPVYTLGDGTTVVGDALPHTDLSGKTVSCISMYLIDGVWRAGDGVTLSGVLQSWAFNADGTGQFSTFRMSTNGIFTWTRNSDNEYIVYMIDLDQSSVQFLTDKDNVVWNNNGVWFTLPEDNSEVVDSGLGCTIN